MHHINIKLLFLVIGHVKTNKDDMEKQKTKKIVQSNSITNGIVKKEKPSNNESKKHNESNSKLFFGFLIILY